MLREMLPKALALALIIASVFPAALVLQAGIAIDLWIIRRKEDRFQQILLPIQQG